MQQSDDALRDQKAKILAEAYDLLILSPEAFMSVYYINIAGQKISNEPDNEAYYLNGQTLRYALSMGIYDNTDPPMILMSPYTREISGRVYSPPFQPYVALMHREEDVAYDEFHLNNLPYLRLTPGSNTRLMVTSQLSGCTMCSWQIDDKDLLVTHIQPAAENNNEKEKDKEKENKKEKKNDKGKDIEEYDEEEEEEQEKREEKKVTGKEIHQSQASRLHSTLIKNGGFIGHPESVGQLTCFGARNYHPQIRNKANILGWQDGDGNWNLTVQVNNPGSRRIIETFPLHSNASYLKPQKPQTEPKEHPYKGPDFRNL